jgi:hypothetical protein
MYQLLDNLDSLMIIFMSNFYFFIKNYLEFQLINFLNRFFVILNLLQSMRWLICYLFYVFNHLCKYFQFMRLCQNASLFLFFYPQIFFILMAILIVFYRQKSYIYIYEQGNLRIHFILIHILK